MKRPASILLKPWLYFENPISSLLPLIVVIGLSCFISLYNVEDTGEQWLEDGPRYLNNAAMVYDYLRSDDYSDPVGFAQRNYHQYPAHNVPYHPPGYAFLLAGWFHIFGMSYFTARCFIGVCTAIFGLAFYGITRTFSATRTLACLTTVVVLLLPEVVLWSRTGMSELPAIMFIAVATHIFLKAVLDHKPRYFWLAYIFALAAFFCRISSAGVLPCWGLAFILSRRNKLSSWIHYALPSGIFLATGISWVKFAAPYSQHEMRRSVGESLRSSLNVEYLLSWWRYLPSSIGWGCVVASCLACIILFRLPHAARFRTWIYFGWIAGCYLVVVGRGGHHENRYFIFALPAFVGLCQIFCEHVGVSLSNHKIANALLVLIVVPNIFSLSTIDDGLVGFQDVADHLANSTERGNVLLATHLGDSDTIFRFRAHNPVTKRTFVRADRTLCIRLADYYRADHPTEPKMLVRDVKECIDLIHKGRIRFLVTWEYNETHPGTRHPDVVLASKLAATEYFSLDRKFVVTRKGSQNNVYIWRYRGELPDGPSEIDAIIPTADMTISSRDRSN